jgi:hypothetical protein
VDVEQEEDLEEQHSSFSPVLLVGKRSRVLRGRQHGGRVELKSIAAVQSSAAMPVVGSSSRVSIESNLPTRSSPGTGASWKL